MLPPKVKNHQVLYQAILDHLEENGSAFSGFTVEDAYLKGEASMERIIKLFIDRIVEDTKGLPNPTCCSVCPAKVGMCPFCEVRGVKVNKRPCYIGAITHLYTRYSYTIYTTST